MPPRARRLHDQVPCRARSQATNRVMAESATDRIASASWNISVHLLHARRPVRPTGTGSGTRAAASIRAAACPRRLRRMSGVHPSLSLRATTSSATSASRRSTTKSCWQASADGPPPSVNCSSSISSLTSSVLFNDPRGMSLDMSMTPAPFTPRSPGTLCTAGQRTTHLPRQTAQPVSGAACRQPSQRRNRGHKHVPRPARSGRSFTCRLLRLRKESVSRDWTQRPCGPGPPGLSSLTLRQRRAKRQPGPGLWTIPSPGFRRIRPRSRSATVRWPPSCLPSATRWAMPWCGRAAL